MARRLECYDRLLRALLVGCVNLGKSETRIRKVSNIFEQLLLREEKHVGKNC
jgi:hypothetical protein